MVLIATLLLCPFTTTSDIFTLKDIAKTHFNNIGLNVPNNAPLAIYQIALAGHWLVMGFKIDNSLVNVWLSKMEATIENIVSLVVANNFAVNQLMEREVAVAVIAKVVFMEEPKWTMVMAKNVR
jgi:hypothetical protein